MNPRSTGRSPGFIEFVILIALIISLVALSIDAMLPALPEIAADLDVQQINDSQYVISIFFAGMAFGQIFFGPLSDSIGRRPSIISGFAVFALGCLLSILAADFEQMLLGRFLQGLGASGPRIVMYLLGIFFFFGILFGNLNALAMEPPGHIAGLGSAVVGSLSTLISVVFGIIIANAYNETILPLVAGFALLGFASLLIIKWTEAGLESES